MTKETGLKRRREFLAVAATRRKWVTPGFVIQIRPFADDEQVTGPRVGFTASKKVGNAVARAKAKRRLRAISRELMPALADPNCDYVLIARPEATTYDFSKLRADLRWALKRLGMRTDIVVEDVVSKSA